MDGITMERSCEGRPALAKALLLASGGFIGGEWRHRSHDGKRFSVVNKADGELIGVLPNFGAREATEAVAVAETARRGWERLTASERSAVMK